MLTGDKELVRALEALPKATARNTLKRVLKKAAGPVEYTMETKAPRLTGWTGKSVDVSFQLNPSQRRDQRKEAKHFAEIHIGSNRGSAAQFLEWGTFKMPARPYLRESWAMTQDGVLATIKRELKVEIEKSAARYARKLAKG